MLQCINLEFELKTNHYLASSCIVIFFAVIH